MKRKLLILMMMCFVGLLTPLNAQETLLDIDFEDLTTMPTSLYTIDGDGDDNNWGFVEDRGSAWSNRIESNSFYYRALTPENYVVTTNAYQITEGTKFSFGYFPTGGDSYYAENFSVVVSTNGYDSKDYFEIISTHTCTQQECKDNEYKEWVVEFNSSNNSSYLNQKVYIGILHHNCTDQGSLRIDNIKLISGSSSGSETTPLSATATAAGATSTTIKTGETTNLSISASGGDENYSYSWTANPSTNVTFGDQDGQTTTFSASAAGEYVVTCTVSDGTGASVTSSVTITVEEESSSSNTIDLTKKYRVKVYSGDNGVGEYLHINSYSVSTSNTTVVGTAASSDVNNQIFTIEDAGSGYYYLKCADGYYIECLAKNAWNVDAYSKSPKTKLQFDYNGDYFYIRNVAVTGDNYFDVQTSGVYCNGSKSAAELWTLEEVVEEDKEFEVSVPATATAYAGKTITITATASGGTSPYNYSWSCATANLSNTSSASCSFSSETIGNHTVTWTVSDSDGSTKTGSVIVTVSEAPSSNIDLSKQYQIRLYDYSYYFGVYSSSVGCMYVNNLTDDNRIFTIAEDANGYYLCSQGGKYVATPNSDKELTANTSSDSKIYVEFELVENSDVANLFYIKYGDVYLTATAQTGTLIYADGATTSAAAQWVLEPIEAPALAVTISGGGSVCENTDYTIEAAATGGVGNYSYQWYKDGMELAGETNATLNATAEGINTASVSYTYTCKVTSGEESVEETADVTIYDIPMLEMTATSFSVNVNTDKVIHVECPEYTNISVNPTPSSISAYTNGGYDITVNLSTDTEFTVQGYNNGGCDNYSEISFSVTVIGEEEKEGTITLNNNDIVYSDNGNKLPSWSQVSYSVTQQIYTAEELDDAGLDLDVAIITSIAFKPYSIKTGAETRIFEVYLKNTESNVFDETTKNMETLTETDKCFDGTVSFAVDSWSTITLSKSFKYEGKNIIVCVYDKTGTDPGANEYYYYLTDECQSLMGYKYQAYSAPDFSGSAEIQMPEDGGYGYCKNTIQIAYEPWCGDETLAANITVDNENLCYNGYSQSFLFTADRICDATYSWTINGTEVSTSQEFIYEAQNIGSYEAVLTVTKDGNTATATKTVTVTEIPSVEFDIEDTFTGEEVTFEVTAPTTNAVYNFVITKPDGTTINISNSSGNETFDVAGVYKVYVTATLNGCSDTSEEKEFNIYPAANFTYTGRCIGNGIVFTNLTEAYAGQTFEWNFGDGNTSTSADQEVKHQYTAAGTYTVSLTVTTNGITNTMSTDVVIDEQPVINFTWNGNKVLEGIVFTGTSSVNGASYIWQVDGEIVIGANSNKMTFEFDTTGDHTVKMMVVVGGCTAELEQTITIVDHVSVPEIVGGDYIDMQYRPVGAWMRPIDVVIQPSGNTEFTINSIEIIDTHDDEGLGEVNFVENLTTVSDKVLSYGEEQTVQLMHDMDNEIFYPGVWGDDTYYPDAIFELNAIMNITYSNSEVTEEIKEAVIRYVAYDPAEGDVFEKAKEVTLENGVYTDEAENMVPNYLLHGASLEDYDAVYKLEFDEYTAVSASVTSGENGHVYIYNADFGGEEGPGATNYIGYSASASNETITDMMLAAGTYYIVASSSSDVFEVTINAETLTAPELAYDPVPQDYAQDVDPSKVSELSWTFGRFTAEYQLLFGITNPPTATLVDWTEKIDPAKFTMPTITNNAIYYWQVNARNVIGTTEGTVWHFTTLFNAPTDLAVNPSTIDVGETATATWTAPETPAIATFKGYNVLANDVKQNADILSDTQFELSGLDAYIYDIVVEAVYEVDGYEITAKSDSVTLQVLGYGTVAGYVYEDDGTPIEGATVKFGTFEFTTDADGKYEGDVYAGSYQAQASKDGFDSSTETVSVENEQTTEQDFVLKTWYITIDEVIAVETVIDEQVDLEWIFEEPISPSFEGFESGGLHKYDWKTSEDYPWQVVEITKGPSDSYLPEDIFGKYCAKSGNTGKGNTDSWLQLTIEAPFDGTMSVRYIVSCGDYGGSDQGKFYVDGEEYIFNQYLYDYYAQKCENGDDYYCVDAAGCFGSNNWGDTIVQIPVTAGEHTFRWVYHKDYGDEVNSEDAFYIDCVEFFDNANVYNIYFRDAFATDATPEMITDSVAGKQYQDIEWWKDNVPADGIYQYGVSAVYNIIDKVNGNRQGESKITWSNYVAKGNKFVTDGDWATAGNWTRNSVPAADEIAILKADAVVTTTDATAGLLLLASADTCSLTIDATGIFTPDTIINEADNAELFVIKAGGQLVHEDEGVKATFKKNIDAYTSDNDGWYTISAPLAANIDVVDVDNMLNGSYDLYRYDEPTHYWENYEDLKDEEPGDPDNDDWGKNGGVIEQGRGYLYANKAATELGFAGEINVSSVSRTLSAASDKLTGFNLLGNPFAHDIYKGVAFATSGELREGFYTLDYHGAWQAVTDDQAIKSGAGFLVQTDANPTIEITKTTAKTRKAGDAMLEISVVNNKYEDIAYVSFKDAKGLEKIGHMNEYVPVLYIPGEYNHFAIASMEDDVTEIPVNFEAMTMGEYTIGVKAQNCEYETMILVDKLTGAEINLNAGTYTFMATTTDDPDRFVIKLAADVETEDSFIYINNNELVFDNISADAIINVFDVLGRNVATFNNCGDTTYRISTDMFADGVYLVRLIEGSNVKVQKVVVE